MSNDERFSTDRDERRAVWRADVSAVARPDASNSAAVSNVGENVGENVGRDAAQNVAQNAGRVAEPSAARPFAFVELERKTTDFLEKIRAEARAVAEETRRELFAVKESVERELRDERAALDAASRDLDERRRVLEDAERENVRRRETLEKETFDQARETGFRQGVDAGKEEGLRLGKEEAAATAASNVEREVAEKTKAFCDAATAPLQNLIREMVGVRRSLLQHWEENAMQIAAAIAYQTIMRDPATTRDVSLDLLREALDLAMNCASLKIRMNPRDVENLREPIRALLEETGNLATAEVVADAKITSGGCVVESSLGVVDERLESRLERIVAELSE